MKSESAGNCVFFNNLSCLYLKNEICLLINTTVLFLKVWLVSLIFQFPFLLYLLPRLSLHRVGILLPPSLLGRAPSRGPHGLCHRTADRVSLCLSLLPAPPPSWHFPSACSVPVPPSSAPLLPGLQACAQPALPGLSSYQSLSFHCMEIDFDLEPAESCLTLLF